MTEGLSAQDIRQELLDLFSAGLQQGWNNVMVQLQSLPEDLVLSILQEVVTHEDPEVRCQAGSLLMDFKGGRHVEFYRPLFRDPVNFVRWHITGSASNLRGVDLDSEIRERLLTDEDISVRVAGSLYLDHVVGLPAIPFLLWLIAHPTQSDDQGHSADSAAETSLTFMVLGAVKESPSVYREGHPFQVGPMTCRVTRATPKPRAEALNGHLSDFQLIERYGQDRFKQHYQGKMPFDVALEATCAYGGFSVTMEIWMDSEEASTHTLDPSTLQVWVVPTEPPPLRVEP